VLEKIDRCFLEGPIAFFNAICRAAKGHFTCFDPGIECLSAFWSWWVVAVARIAYGAGSFSTSVWCALYLRCSPSAHCMNSSTRWPAAAWAGRATDRALAVGGVAYVDPPPRPRRHALEALAPDRWSMSGWFRSCMCSGMGGSQPEPWKPPCRGIYEFVRTLWGLNPVSASVQLLPILSAGRRPDSALPCSGSWSDARAA